jgi:GDP/UDP-N,N'-diacetylbacillosamine 2-epimerase (hydrolysing)
LPPIAKSCALRSVDEVARRILVILDSRASYGYTRCLMRTMANTPSLELATLVTGGHLLSELGNSVEAIRADGFPISAEVHCAPAGNARSAWTHALGLAVAGYGSAFERLAPDIILLAGDRIETFGCCIAATYMHIAMAHIQAGDKSGHIDDLARMAIAKLAHIHFAADEGAATRLRRLGEQEFRIHVVGAPQLDEIVSHDYSNKSIILDGVSHGLAHRYILLTQHPVMAEVDRSGAHMRDTLEACLETGLPIYGIYPNSDVGYRDIISVMEEFSANARTHFFRYLERREYLTLLANAAVLVGNTSSGILEAPSFRVPVVNIGDRQRGRLRASNILDVPHDKAAIKAAIQRALHDSEFLAACARAKNPYGDGKSGQRICNILSSVPFDGQLLDKETVY